MFDDDVALNADGMIARFNIENGAVDYDIRYVETERYLAEKQAQRPARAEDEKDHLH